MDEEDDDTDDDDEDEETGSTAVANEASPAVDEVLQMLSNVKFNSGST